MIAGRLADRGRYTLAKGQVIRKGYKTVWCANRSCPSKKKQTSEYGPFRVLPGVDPVVCPHCGNSRARNRIPYTAWRMTDEDHFVFHPPPEGLPDLNVIYGTDCKRFRIWFPWDTEHCVKSGYIFWTGNRFRVCRGNGDYIEAAYPWLAAQKVKRSRGGKETIVTSYRRDQQDQEPLIMKGKAIRAFTWGENAYLPGDIIPCPGSQYGAGVVRHPQCAACRRSTWFRFLLAPTEEQLSAHPDLISAMLRLYSLSTSGGFTHDATWASLEMVYTLRGTVAFFPFWLELHYDRVTYHDDQGPHSVPKWLITLNPDPEAFLRAGQAYVQGRPALPSPQVQDAAALPTGEPVSWDGYEDHPGHGEFVGDDESESEPAIEEEQPEAEQPTTTPTQAELPTTPAQAKLLPTPVQAEPSGGKKPATDQLPDPMRYEDFAAQVVAAWPRAFRDTTTVGTALIELGVATADGVVDRDGDCGFEPNAGMSALLDYVAALNGAQQEAVQDLAEMIREA